MRNAQCVECGSRDLDREQTIGDFDEKITAYECFDCGADFDDYDIEDAPFQETA